MRTLIPMQWISGKSSRRALPSSQLLPLVGGISGKSPAFSAGMTILRHMVRFFSSIPNNQRYMKTLVSWQRAGAPTPLALSGLSRVFSKRLTIVLLAVFAGFFVNPQLSMAAPVVTSINPTVGPTAGGTLVTISGSGFTGVLGVTFGGTASLSVGFVDDSTLTALSPAQAAGTVDVLVTTPLGTSATSPADQFTYVPPPVVTGLNPATSYVYGGTSVTITGTNFTGATAVTFGITAATSFTVTNATTIVAVTPVESAGVVDVTITTPVGGTSATVLADRFSFLLPPPTPTLGEWSMIALALLLAGAGYLALRRMAARRTA